MNTQDLVSFNQAVQLAQSGNKMRAYQQLKELLWRYNANPDPNLLLWVAFTSPNFQESEWAISRVAALDPANPNLASAQTWLETERYFQTRPPASVVPPASASGATPVVSAAPLTTQFPPPTTKAKTSGFPSRIGVFAAVGVVVLILIGLVWYFGLRDNGSPDGVTPRAEGSKPVASPVVNSSVPATTVLVTPTVSVTSVAITTPPTSTGLTNTTPTALATSSTGPASPTSPGPTPTSTLLPSLRTAATAAASLTLTPAPSSPTPANLDPLSSVIKEATDTALVKGDFKQAVTKFDLLLKQYPDKASVWRDYGFVLYIESQDKKALEALEKAAKLDPTDPLTFIFLAYAYANNNRTKEAKETIKTVVQLDPKGWLGNIAQANIYIDNFQLELVATPVLAAQKAAAASGKSNDTLYNYLIATPLEFVPNHTAAKKALDKVIADWSKVPAIMVTKANTYVYGTNNPTETEIQKGMELILEADRLQPDTAAFQAVAADYAYYVQNDPATAQKFAQRALKLQETIPMVHRLLATLALKKKDYPQAFKEFERCVQLSNHMLDCYYYWSEGLISYGTDLKEQGKQAESDQVMHKAQEVALEIYNLLPKVPNVYSNWSASFNDLIGRSAFYLKQYAVAITNFQKAISYNSQNAELYGWLGFAYLGNDQKTKALEAYRKGYGLNSNNSTITALGNALESAPEDEQKI